MAGLVTSSAVKSVMGAVSSSSSTRLFSTKEKEEEKGGGHSVPGKRSYCFVVHTVSDRDKEG